MKRQRHYFLLVILLATLAWQNTPAQTSDSIVTKFNRYRQNSLTEKIFIHLDRTSLLTGETLWLKVYCVEAGSNTPLDFSKVAYVDIIDQSGKSVLKAKIELKEGIGNASLFIPATLNSGNYSVIAYTNWMKNSPKEYFFTQPVVIINPFRKTEGPPATAGQLNQELDAQFFPEGGNLIAEVPTKIGFRVVDNSGHGISFTGVVKDDSGNTVTTFQPSLFGLGNFILTAEKAKTYHAEITDSNGKMHSISFPKAQNSGYALRVTETESQFEISVRAREVDQAVVSFFVHANNKTIQHKSSLLKNNEASFSLDKKKLKAGISHVTIFNDNLDPVAERLIFIKPSNQKLEINSDNADYSPRRKVKINVLRQPSSKNPYELSVSIYRRDSLPEFEHHTINSYLHLTSDLHGQIENPNFYFEHGSAENFDNLMLTHGWRKFSWEKIKRSDFAYRCLPEIEGPVVEGTVYDETGKPAKNIATYLSTPSKKIQLYGSVSDTSGRVRYTLKNITGSKKIYLQTNFAKDSLFDIKLDDPFVEFASSQLRSPYSLDKNLSTTLTTRSVAMQAQDIFWESDRAIVTETDSLPFFGKPDETYFLDDFTRFPVMEEVMREYVKGVWVRKRKDEFVFIVLDNVNKAVFNENSLILLDGVPIFRVNDIMNVNPLKIKKIDVITRQLHMGKISLPGIVSFTSYTNDLAGIQLDRKNIIIDYSGLQQSRTFFSPVYDTERQRSNRLPDQRNLLYWNPSLKMEDAQATFDCYTSDLPGTYEVFIQGISADGKPISGKHTFTVTDFNN